MLSAITSAQSRRPAYPDVTQMLLHLVSFLSNSFVPHSNALSMVAKHRKSLQWRLTDTVLAHENAEQRTCLAERRLHMPLLESGAQSEKTNKQKSRKKKDE